MKHEHGKLEILDGDSGKPIKMNWKEKILFAVGVVFAVIVWCLAFYGAYQLST